MLHKCAVKIIPIGLPVRAVEEDTGKLVPLEFELICAIAELLVNLCLNMFLLSGI